MADEAVLFQSALSSVVGGIFGDNSGAIKQFQTLLKRLRLDDS